jgi:hypothetical protein
MQQYQRQKTDSNLCIIKRIIYKYSNSFLKIQTECFKILHVPIL